MAGRSEGKIKDPEQRPVRPAQQTASTSPAPLRKGSQKNRNAARVNQPD